MTDETKNRPAFVSKWPNMASPRTGSSVIAASDEFFAAKERLISDSAPIFIADKYDYHGKWMDGWESRRRRDGGHDWCILRLGISTIVHGVEIDTAHFTGNYPPGASIEAGVGDDPSTITWVPLLTRVSLKGDHCHFFEIPAGEPCNFIRLNIYPDGGVARLRVYGEAVPNWGSSAIGDLVELSALSNGGRVVAYNDAHYGNVNALLLPGRGETMGDGWETRRRREPGNDWIIVALGSAGTVEKIEIDTAHFKGNFPESASVQGAFVDPESIENDAVTEAMFWHEILPRQKLSADTQHFFEGESLIKKDGVNIVKLNIYPDGGVSRLRIFGKRT